MVYRTRKRFRIRKQKKVARTWQFWIVVLVSVVLLVFLWFVIYRFQIKSVIVSGNQRVDSSEITKTVFSSIERSVFFVKTKSTFVINTEKAVQDILNNFPLIGDVKIQRRWFDTVSVNVKERVPFVVYCAENCFFVDEKGIAYENAENTKGYIIVRQNNEETQIGLAVLSDRTIAEISLLKQSQVEISSVDIVSDTRMNAKTAEGWKIYFDRSGDIGLQITKLNLLLEKELTDRGALQYVDLRFGDRAYYK